VLRPVVGICHRPHKGRLAGHHPLAEARPSRGEGARLLDLAVKWWIREEKRVYFEVQCRDGAVMTTYRRDGGGCWRGWCERLQRPVWARLRSYGHQPVCLAGPGTRPHAGRAPDRRSPQTLDEQHLSGRRQPGASQLLPGRVYVPLQPTRLPFPRAAVLSPVGAGRPTRAHIDPRP